MTRLHTLFHSPVGHETNLAIGGPRNTHSPSISLMPRAMRLPCFVLAAVLSSACGAPSRASTGSEQSAFDLAAARQLIVEQNQRFTAAHVAGDSAAIDSMFTEDARSYPPGADAAIGLPAIHALTVEYLKAGITEFREETTDFYGNAEYVVDAGTYVLTYGPGPVTERGKYLNVWKHVNGSWKLQSNMWNTNAEESSPK